jgi:hypothetical protein
VFGKSLWHEILFGALASIGLVRADIRFGFHIGQLNALDANVIGTTA